MGSQSVKVLCDFYHEQRAFGNLIEKLEKNFDWVGFVHVADVPGRHEPGTSEIDYGNIFRKLAELKYEKFIAMEYYPAEDPTDSLKAARLDMQQAVRTVPPASQRTGNSSNQILLQAGACGGFPQHQIRADRDPVGLVPATFHRLMQGIESLPA
jgi:hypothetical protein